MLMKTSIKITFLVCISVLLFSSCYTTKTISEPVYETKKVPVYDDEYSVKYNRTDNLFVGRSGSVTKPISLAIMEFSYKANDRKYVDYELMNKFYKELINTSGFYNNFQPFKWTTIRDFYNISNLDVNNRATQISLYNQKIYFCCGAYCYKNSIRFKIYRTSDGKLVFNELLRESSNSTYINDAVNVFMYNYIPEYYYKILRYEEKNELVRYKTREEKEFDFIKTWLSISIYGALIMVIIAAIVA